MPKVKNQAISIVLGRELGSVSTSIEIHVNTSGVFSCAVPDELGIYFDIGKRYSVSAVDSVYCRNNRRDKKSLYSNHIDDLGSVCKEALKSVSMPVVEKTNIIRFNIQTKVSFAYDKEGNIFPNAACGEDLVNTAERGVSDPFGYLHATNNIHGGYLLKIGAEACTKIVTFYGGKKQIEYIPYQNGSSECSLLNGWRGFILDNPAREIPYSDKAALFFHNMLKGMAQLSSDIQKFTLDDNDLMGCIESGVNMERINYNEQ